MHVIATAGHVDHGKSRLVQALTGMDPDRLEEEKRRGLTIDLGFAWLKLPSGREVGIVDVPGHERFIKNMLAGVGAINVTLFVVAANEGWKPQSQEHLVILDLLGVRAAIVAITKVDLVDAHRLAEVTDQIADRIRGTALEGAPLIPVSAENGMGLDLLVQNIESLLENTPPAPDFGRPRLWIDRVFTIRGSGTVVTGTLTDGSIDRQEEVVILPKDRPARVRSIQSHKRTVDRIGPGNRTALNLTGPDLQSIERGDIVTTPGTWIPTSRALVELRFLSDLEHELSERGSYKLYIGSAERDARVRFLERQPVPGESIVASVVLDQPVVLDWLDQFVLRDAGRRETLGGGVIIEPHPDEVGMRGRETAIRRRELRHRLGYARQLIEERGLMAREDLRLRTGIDPSSVDSPDTIDLKGLIASSSWFADVSSRLADLLSDHHRMNPLEAGLPRESARSALGLDPKTFDVLEAEMHQRQVIALEGAVLRLPDHEPPIAGPERDSLLEELEKADASPPTVAELQSRFDPSLIRALVRSGELVQVNSELVFPAVWIESLKQKLMDLLSSGPITVAAFRDAVGTTRKYAVPLLEYMDQIGFTRRRGDVRVPGPRGVRGE